MANTKCISCGSDKSQFVLAKETAKHGTIHLRECDACGLIFLDEWTGSFDDELYDYYSKRIGKPMSERYNALNTKRHEDQLRIFENLVAGRKLLDVGCGEGHFVHSANAMGWDARGIDLAEGAIGVAKSFGVPCDVVDFFSTALDGERFDIIVMSELLEHVPDPGSFLARAESLLSPRGILYLTTPNFGSLTRRVVGTAWRAIEREHLSYFTPQTFRRLVARRTHFDVAEVETRNVELAAIASSLRPHKEEQISKKQSVSVSAPATSTRKKDQNLRAQIARYPLLGALKNAANVALDKAGAGDSLIAYLRKTGA